MEYKRNFYYFLKWRRGIFLVDQNRNMCRPDVGEDEACMGWDLSVVKWKQNSVRKTHQTVAWRALSFYWNFDSYESVQTKVALFVTSLLTTLFLFKERDVSFQLPSYPLFSKTIAEILKHGRHRFWWIRSRPVLPLSIMWSKYSFINSQGGWTWIFLSFRFLVTLNLVVK